MNDGSRQVWVRAVALLGIGYALVGIVFALPTTHMQAWRRAAWVVCAIGYAAHIAYERFALKSPARVAALHVGLAVALGAFGLAAAANIHSLAGGSGTRLRPLLLMSLAIWPVITALPAFLLALGIGAVLARLFPDS